MLLDYSLSLERSSAVRLMLAEGKHVETNVRLRRLARDITLRGGTSDIDCFRKVFVDNEYQLPFDFTPKSIIDAGANIGMATLYFRQEFPEAQIIAIEPEATNANLLRRNTAGLLNIEVIEAALWPTKKELALKDPAAEKWAFSVTEENNGGANSVKVPTVTVPELLDRFGFERLDLLKLDIEGAEKALFGDGAEAWMRRVNVIVIELHDRYLDGCSRQFYRALQPFPFTQEPRGENLFVRTNVAK